MSGSRDLRELTDAMLATFADLSNLDPEGMKVGLEGARQLITTAEPTTPEAIAKAAGVPTDRVREVLADFADRGVVFFDEGGRIPAMWAVTVPGTAIPETPHRVEVEGRTIFAWCALDPLYFVDDFGITARISSTCPVTGRAISFVAGPGGIRDLSPQGTVVSLILPEGPISSDVIARFCHFVNYFATEEAARQWLAEQEGTFEILGIEGAYRLVQEHDRRLRTRG